MKPKTQYLIILFTISCFLIACHKNSDDIFPILEAPSIPSGGVFNCIVAAHDSSSITLESSFYVVNGFGTFINSVVEDQITMNHINNDAITILETNLNVSTTIQKGDFSAMMLFDDSGSISSNDPNDDRIKAGKALTRLMNNREEIAISKFTTNLSNNFEILAPFTNDTLKLMPKIDELALGESGGTPLFYSINELLDSVHIFAKNESKSLIAFTDGEDNGPGSVDINAIIQKANNYNIPVYTIGLGTNTDLSLLAQLAYETEGAVMLADDAIQLISLYSSLSQLMRGSTDYYKLKIKLAKDGFVSGGNGAYVVITLPSGDIVRLQLAFNLP